MLPTDPTALPDVLAQWFRHPADPSAPPVPAEAIGEKSIRSVAELLGLMADRAAGNMDQALSPERCLRITCRSFSLLAVAVLRQAGVPARLRVGFADYFTPDFLEDHWVCELHDGIRWRLFDAQMSAAWRQRLVHVIVVDDVASDRFRSAASVWQAVRSGAVDGDRLGVSFIGIAGGWFVPGSIQRDLAAQCKDEMLPWDYWGLGASISDRMSIADDEAEKVDALAAALLHAPTILAAARGIVDRFPWAARPPEIFSYPVDRAVTVRLDDAAA